MPQPDRTESAARTLRWECQVGTIEVNGGMAIFDVTFETPDVREAIKRACSDFPSEDIEWVKVRRVEN